MRLYTDLFTLAFYRITVIVMARVRVGDRVKGKRIYQKETGTVTDVIGGIAIVRWDSGQLSEPVGLYLLEVIPDPTYTEPEQIRFEGV